MSEEGGLALTDPTGATSWRPAAPVPFWRMSGSGNDFVVVDNREGTLPAAAVRGFARAVCRRGRSVGADGLVLIEATPPAAIDPETGEPVAFGWRYVNADGSDGAFCGNGAICAARYAVLRGIAPARCAFATPSGVVHAEVLAPAEPRVRVAIPDPGPVGAVLAVGLDGGGALALRPVTVGVPHAVLLLPEGDTVDGWPPTGGFAALGRAVRRHAAFAPAGTNLDVVDVVDGATARMRTYERGVEAETLACGSGAVASALVATAAGRARPPVAVVTRGGPTLTVDFAWDAAAGQASRVTLSGEARVVARGEIDPEALD